MEPTSHSSENPRNTSSLRAFTVGVAGAAVVAMAVAGLGLVGAGAQEPTTTSVTAPFTSAVSVDPNGSSDLVDPVDDAAWAAYDACFDANLGAEAKAMFDSFDEQPDGPVPVDSVGQVDQAAMDVIDAQFQAADQACRDQLPADLQAEMAAWDEYDTCMADIGYPDDAAFGGPSMVSVDTPDGFQSIDLGSGPATVTITSDGTTVSVESTGDATVLDEAALDAQWAEFDKAASACDKFLPEDALLDPAVVAPGSLDGAAVLEPTTQG